MQLIVVGGGGEGKQRSWGCWIHLGQEVRKKPSKIEVYAGMAKPMVRDLAIKETIQEKIKDTLKHNNQSYVEWCAQTDKIKTTHLFPGLIC